MSAIPTSLTEMQFNQHVHPYLSTAKRGFEYQVPLYYDPVYWRRDGSLEKVWQGSIMTIRDQLHLSELNWDGSHAIAKKGGESVAYQERERAKATNILPIIDSHGFIVVSMGLLAGNHNDAFNLKHHLQTAFKAIKQLGLVIEDAFFNADKAFDTKAARKTCFNHGLIPNIAGNKRNRRKTKSGRKRLFNAKVYKRRFTSEWSFAWIDKFYALLLRFERRDDYYLGNHYIVFAMINLRHIIATQ